MKSQDEPRIHNGNVFNLKKIAVNTGNQSLSR